GAVNTIRSVFGETAASTERGKVTPAEFNGANARIIRATHTAEEGFDVSVDFDNASKLKQALVDAGAVAVANDVFETLRLEAGIPRYGVDMDETTVLNETNLEDAISFTKGYYVGQ